MNRRGKGLAVRLVKYTGKSPHFIHPKHLVSLPWTAWYLAHLHPSDRVLDVGCANGTHTLRVAGRCRSVVGVDYDQTQLGVAHAQLGVAGASNVAFVLADVTTGWPFREKQFDAVLCLDVIEHLVPRGEVLRTIRRGLKDDGRLLISAPNRETAWRRRLREAGLFAFSDPDHKVEYTREEFTEELERGGFRVESLQPAVYDTPWAGLIDVLGGLSLALYRRLATWKRQRALTTPAESTGFWVVARPR